MGRQPEQALVTKPRLFLHFSIVSFTIVRLESNLVSPTDPFGEHPPYFPNPSNDPGEQNFHSHAVLSLGRISGAASPSKRQREWYYRNIFQLSRAI
jgi:hypothetical protein